MSGPNDYQASSHNIDELLRHLIASINRVIDPAHGLQIHSGQLAELSHAVKAGVHIDRGQFDTLSGTIAAFKPPAPADNPNLQSVYEAMRRPNVK
jgi:hypothetical protein